MKSLQLASIIAKVSRDSAMEELSQELNIDLGSGYPSDPKTKEALEILCEEEVLCGLYQKRMGECKESLEQEPRSSHSN